MKSLWSNNDSFVIIRLKLIELSALEYLGICGASNSKPYGVGHLLPHYFEQSNQMIYQNPYLKFLMAYHELEGSESKALDLVGEKLLGYITVQYSKELTLTVTECMRIKTVASPATIHRKISELIQEGWIATLFEGNKRRTKYLAPTPKAIKYFEKISKLMIKSSALG